MERSDGGIHGSTDDRTLVQRAASGDSTAFETLYRRYADTAWRAAQGILRSKDAASDAVADAFTSILRAVRSGDAEHIEHFRAYLLAATRNAALDRLRSREDAYGSTAVELADQEEPTASPIELLIDLTDESFVMQAFRELPDRWRQVLWLTEVKRLRTTDVAEEMGINANAVAQLAFRARAGLRERFVQAHLDTPASRACAPFVERLGAFTLGGLRANDRAEMAAHLEVCLDCTARYEQLADLAVQRRPPSPTAS